MNPSAVWTTCSRSALPPVGIDAAASSNERITRRSRVTTPKMSGRCTLTATWRPHVSASASPTPATPGLSVALYTCPMDAAATGFANAVAASSKTSSNSSPLPSCALIIARASADPKGATWSKSFCSSSR